MHQHSEKIILPFTKEQIFNLVMDIEKYPEFLPWCHSAKILQKVADNLLYADLEINYKAFKYKYTSEVKYSLEDGIIDVHKIRGPFRHLKNVWKLKEIGEQTEVEFSIELELKSKLLDKTLILFFDHAYRKMLTSFRQRAEELYS
jgi:coenzyme Q-binding protein COQ10